MVRFGLDESEPESLVDGEREIASFSVASNGRYMAYTVSDPTTPYEIFVRDDGVERRLTRVNDALVSELEIAPVEPFSTTSSDGETVHGWLMQPLGFQKRKQWPLILQVHGGPEAMYSWSFMHEFQVLAGRGLGVLYTIRAAAAATARRFARASSPNGADRTRTTARPPSMRPVSLAGLTGRASVSRAALTAGS
jgi:hypothetical protein